MKELITFLLLTPPSLFIRALVLVDLWKWFVIPLGAPTIGLAHALGLSLILEWCTKSSKADGRTTVDTIVDGTILSLFVWVFGAIFAWMM